MLPASVTELPSPGAKRGSGTSSTPVSISTSSIFGRCGGTGRRDFEDRKTTDSALDVRAYREALELGALSAERLALLTEKQVKYRQQGHHVTARAQKGRVTRAHARR